MADIPVPRSESQIIAEMLDTFLSITGLPDLPVGDPVLNIIEAAARSDLRSSQDIFNFLNALALDRASDRATENIGRDERVPRIGQSPSSGKVTITDSTFSKIATRIYQGSGAPIIGTTTLRIEDGDTFPTSGSVYLGRGTNNYEGPLDYSAKTNIGSYWTLTLSDPTTKFHQLGETVILAQGGDRPIAAGTVVRTRTSGASSGVQFSVLYDAVIPDGEVSVDSVSVVCKTSGTVGNVQADSIREFVGSPFTGATVTNPVGYSNGLDTEDLRLYKERIRKARASRALGIPLAIKTSVLGLVSLEEGRRILSAEYLSRQGQPGALIVDDGTGYEESETGVPFEVLESSATGGERFFQLVQGRPVTKARLKSGLSSPFTITDQSRLAVRVGDVLTTHIFDAADFRNLETASSYEIVASINKNSNLLWEARTEDSGANVVIQAKSDTEEYIHVVDPDTGLIDANYNLGFPVHESQSLWLYKNDRLLSKDGKEAVLETKPNLLWPNILSGDTLTISVDGIEVVATVTDQAFIDAGTPYSTVSRFNSLASWAAVFNSLIPGVTATVAGDNLKLTSNRGRKDSASLEVTDGVLLAIFDNLSSQGVSKDYDLNRNLGQLELISPLEASDRLTAGSYWTRGFVETPRFTTHDVTAEDTSVTGESGAELWFFVDGAATLIPTGTSAGASIAVALNDTLADFKRVRFSSATSADIFTNVAVGDWLIVTDTALNINNRGAWRIIATASTYVDVEQPSAWANAETQTLDFGGMVVVRSEAVPQRVYLPAGNDYTPTTVASSINDQIVGATATVYRTQQVRVRTNTFSSGDIAFVAGNQGGLDMGIVPASAIISGVSHLANLLATNSEAGTPDFVYNKVSAVTDSVTFDPTTLASPADVVVGLRTPRDTSGKPRYGNKNFVSRISHIETGTFHLRDTVPEHWLVNDAFYCASTYGLTARDTLGVVLDGDQVSGRFVFDLYRKMKPAADPYGTSIVLLDNENGDVSPGVAFGPDFDWKDFALHMKARTSALGLLWRYYRHGAEGNSARLAYTYPDTADTAVGVTVDSRTTDMTDIRINLASGGARTLSNMRNTSKLGVAQTSGPDGNGLYKVVVVSNMDIASASKTIRLNYSTRSAAFTLGETITGGTSGATATVTLEVFLGGAGYLVIGAVAGTFVDGETITGGTSGSTATVDGTQYSSVSMSVTPPTVVPALTSHGLTVGDIVWIDSSDGNFPSGPKVVVTQNGAFLFSYLDVTTTTATFAGTGTMSMDPAGIVNFDGGGVVTGDILSVKAGSSLPTTIEVPLRTSDSGLNYLTLTSPIDTNGGSPNTTVPTWYAINNTDNIEIFPLDAAQNLIDSIATSVNAISGSPVSGVRYSTNVPLIGATYEAPSDGVGATDPWFYLSDGINWVRSHTTSVNPVDDVTFTLKEDVNADLVTDPVLALSIDDVWPNEDVRLVPTTTKNVTDFMRVLAVTGLGAAAEVTAAGRGLRPQITTSTVGGLGSVFVTGGTGNGLQAVAVGAATDTGSTCVIAAEDSETQGLAGNAWVRLQNTITAPKNIITSATTVDLASDGTLLLGATKVWKYPQDTANAYTAGLTWQIERHGKFMAYVRVAPGTINGVSSLREGDWVYITGTGATVSALNQGWFRVVRTNATDVFWVDNPNGVEEVVTANVRFLDYDSAIPGDILHINTNFWDAANIGTWTVQSLDFSGVGDQQYRCVIGPGNPTAVTASALGSKYPLVRFMEGTPTSLVKRITGIAPGSGSLAEIRFDTDKGSRGISKSYGTVIVPLDKLAFGVDAETGATVTPVPGVDAYLKSLGLIAEANKVIYGEESDSSNFHGVAAAGSNININGPLIRRIKTAWVLRVNGDEERIGSAVKSAVAAVINKTPVGTAVSIGAMIAAAMSIDGVVGVSLQSPVYNTTNDNIGVQPNEKPLVLDVDADVLISFVGA